MLVVDQPTNLQVLRRSTRNSEPGDIFALRIPDGTYLFGRVIGTELDPPAAPMPLSYLVYVYAHRSQAKHPELDALRPDRLLLPPVFINRMPWTKGYFETVDHKELGNDNLLPQHCFWDVARARHVDERQNPLPEASHPCGEWGLASYLWLDAQVSDALGIPRAAKH